MVASRLHLIDVVGIELESCFLSIGGRILVSNRCIILLLVGEIVGVGVRIDVWGVREDVALGQTDDVVEKTVEVWVCARDDLRGRVRTSEGVAQWGRRCGHRGGEDIGGRGRVGGVGAWCAIAGTVRGYEGGAEGVEDAGAVLLPVEVGWLDVGELVVGEGDVEGCDEEVERLSGCVLVERTKGRIGVGVDGEPGGKGRRMGDVVVVGVLEGAEEFLVSLDVLAAVGLDPSVDGAFGAFVGECAGETGELGVFDVLHRRCTQTGTLNNSEQIVDQQRAGVGGAGRAVGDSVVAVPLCYLITSIWVISEESGYFSVVVVS